MNSRNYLGYTQNLGYSPEYLKENTFLFCCCFGLGFFLLLLVFVDCLVGWFGLVWFVFLMEKKIFQRSQYFTGEIFSFTRKAFCPRLNTVIKISTQFYFLHKLCPFTPRWKMSLCQDPALWWWWHREECECPSSQILWSGRSGNLPHIPQTLADHPAWLYQSPGISHCFLENNAKIHFQLMIRSYSGFSKISGSSWSTQILHY